MNQKNLVMIIKEQALRDLWNINNVINCVPDDYWDKIYCEMPLWKHMYHMLHSLDQWYINPRKYLDPPFHSDNLNNLDVKTEKILSREELKKYYKAIEEKINQYVNCLTDDILLIKPEECEWTRFTLILGQQRHLNCHLGMIMGFIIAGTGLWPRVIGLEGDIPPVNYNLYF